jgi:hypothetical protein
MPQHAAEPTQTQRKAEPEKNSGVDGGVDNPRIATSDVLSMVEKKGTVPMVGHAEWIAGGGDSLLMMDHNARVIDHAPASLLGTPAPVLVLAVHEESLIQLADLPDHLATDHEKSSDDGVHIGHFHFVKE